MNLKIIALICLLSVIITIFFTGCIKNDNNIFSINQFIEEVESRNYEFQIQDVKKDFYFLRTKGKMMTIEGEQLTIYLFKSNKTMEKAANGIQKDGSGYESKSLLKPTQVEISWVSDPHFFKKGNIIVKYIGTNKEIIELLKEILGPQFAGL